MTRDKFFNEIKKYFNIDPLIMERFDIYKEFLQEQNKIHNLTKLDSDDDIYQQYFFESLIPFLNIDLNHKKLLDIGSGSGIPGIVLAILFKNMELTIIESNNKKCLFLKSLVNKLNLQNVNVLNKRAEEINFNMRNTFDYVTSRAVASLKILIEISTPYLKLDGWLIEPKSTNYQSEYEQAQTIIKDIGISLIEIKEYNDLKTHYIFIFKKIKETPSIYPRKWKEIIK